MAACGQTRAQTLHWEQASGSQVGTVAAMARRSMAVMPGGTNAPAVHDRGRVMLDGTNVPAVHIYMTGGEASMA